MDVVPVVTWFALLIVFAVVAVGVVGLIATVVLISRSKSAWIPLTMLGLLGLFGAMGAMLFFVRAGSLEEVGIDTRVRRALAEEEARFETEVRRSPSSDRSGLKDSVVFETPSDANESLPPATAVDGAEPESTGSSEPPADAVAAGPSAAPPWINDSLNDDGLGYQRVITAGPFPDRVACDRELDLLLVSAARDFAERRFGFPNREMFDVDAGYLRDRVVADHWERRTIHSFGPGAENQTMYQVYLLLDFDAEDQRELAGVARKTLVQGRLWYAGFALTAALALLTTALGYLRVNTATGGQYKGRLKLAAGGVILAVAVAGAVLADFVPLV